MEKIKISNKEIRELLTNQEFEYPKYVTQIMNLANQNAQGTRPRVVGQMSDLIQEFEGGNVAEWESWYKDKHPSAIDEATEKVYAMIQQLKQNITCIDKDMVRRWVEELVVVKTFAGLRFQEAILRKIAESKGQTYRLANPSEEAQGIDGFIGDVAVSVKGATYMSKDMLPEQIDVEMIYYNKKKSEIVVEFDF